MVGKKKCTTYGSIFPEFPILQLESAGSYNVLVPFCEGPGSIFAVPSHKVIEDGSDLFLELAFYVVAVRTRAVEDSRCVLIHDLTNSQGGTSCSFLVCPSLPSHLCHHTMLF